MDRDAGMNEKINLTHKEMTDEEIYQSIKNHQDVFTMSAKEWKKRRLIELKKEGKNWGVSL